MGEVYLLDCTLRDGGYVNDWAFGRECIQTFPDKLIEANIDIMELGFIRNESKNYDRSVFTSIEDLNRFKRSSLKKDVIYSAMIEGNERDATFPVSKLGTPVETGIDLIRICTWKRLMKEHLDYCKEVSDLGYKVSIQPTAIDQYNDDEFIKLLKLANNVNPFAFYLVDTWGTQSSKQIIHYAHLADKYLNKDINLGYHGHNNKMQALSCVATILELNFDRGVCVDSSVMGMGRGPGNLQTEVVMDYLNENYNKNYDVDIVIDLYSKYIKKIYDITPWGYSVHHFVSSRKSLPQDFATYFKENDYSIDEFYQFISSLQQSERVTFRKQFVESRLKELGLLHTR